MANSLFDYDDSSPPPAVDPWNDNSQYAPTPGDFGRSPTLSSISPSPDRILPQEEPNQLVFHPLTGWKEGGEYNQESLKYICYTIAWKLVLNDKTVGRVTEEDLVVAPSDYWKRSLKASLEDMLQTKKKRNQRVRSEGTAITVSVDERSLKDFEKFYNSTNIYWTPVEKQLRKWSNLLRNGKTLRVIIAFHYGHDDSSLPTSGRVDKRGPVSATRRMLAERDAQIQAEEESTGRPSTWNLVYGRMRCDVRSCHLNSNWCWEDPLDKKHYKLRSSHLGRLISYVDGGGSLECHDDVPDDIRRDLYLENQHRVERASKRAKSIHATEGQSSPININVLPAQCASVMTSSPSGPANEHPVIPGPREAAVRDYCRWLESQATEEAYKADYQKVCKVTLENHLDLELILEDPDPRFFIEQGIKKGTALHFVRDIYKWAKYMEINSS